MIIQEDGVRVTLVIVQPARLSTTLREANGERTKDRNGVVLPDYIAVGQELYSSSDGKAWTKKATPQTVTALFKQAQLSQLPNGTIFSLQAEKTVEGKQVGTIVLDYSNTSDPSLVKNKTRTVLEYDKQTYLPMMGLC